MDAKQRLQALTVKHSLDMASPTTTPLKAFLDDLAALINETQGEQDRLQKLMELSLEEMQQWWKGVEQREAIIKSVLDVSVDCIITLDHQGNISEFNHVAEKTFGLPKSIASGQFIGDILAPGPFTTELKNLFSDQQLEHALNLDGSKMRFKIHCKSNREFTADVTMNRIETGSDIVYPLFIRDLTEQIAAQKSLEESRSQATQSAKMASLGEMAGGIAHEINTPLNVFTMYAEMLREAADEGNLDATTIIDAATTIEETALRISKIIQGLRNFSRDDSQDEMVLASISNIVSDTLALCKTRFLANGVKLHIDSFDDTWMVLGRPTSLCQVLLNLLNNAYDAIEHIPDRWIRISCTEDGLNYSLAVTDCGPGIPAETVKRLMEPFFTTKGIGKGTGLGLSLSKGIVENHYGNLIYDASSKNTKFVIILPKVILNKQVS